MSMHRRLRGAAFCAGLALPTLLISGCSGDGTVSSAAPTNLATGNWQISSSAAAASRLPSLSGELTTKNATITGILHSQSSSACIAPAAAFELAGSADSNDLVTLTADVASGTLTVTGTLAADGKSLINATYNVVGGSCAFSDKVQATAQAFSPMQGNYAGNFADADGNIAAVTANLSQSTTPDANGNFTLAGTAAVTSNPCFPSTLTLTNTQVTGNTFTYTLTPANTANSNGNSVTASGTFSADGSTLTVTSWTSTGSCGADTGVQSIMARQSR